MNIFKATLDTRHQNGVIGPITQFDNATLELQILSGGQVAEPWDSPEFELIAIKRDMNQVREVEQEKFTILSKEDHRVQIELKEQFLTYKGSVKMQLVIKDGSRLSTTIFYLSIGQSLDHTIIESLKDIEVLDDLDEVVESLSTFEVTATNNEAKRQHNEKLREVAESNRQEKFIEAQNQRDTEFNEKMNEYQDYVSGLKGEKGEKGERGEQGPQGPRGVQGERGIQGQAGKDGRDGITPNVQIGTVTTLEPSQEATVTIRGTKENPILDFGIPKGEKGADAQDGQDGQGGGSETINTIIKENKERDKKLNKIKLEKTVVNFLSKADVVKNRLINKNGVISESFLYDNARVFLEKGTYVLRGKTRNIFLFQKNSNGELTLLQTISNSTIENDLVFTLQQDGFLAINFFVGYVENARLLLGNRIEEVEDERVVIEDLFLENIGIEQLAKEVTSKLVDKKIELLKDNHYLYMTSLFDEVRKIKMTTQIDETRNGCFNFVKTELIDGTSLELIHDNNDDIAPLRTFYTVGANHGYPSFNVTSNGQTTLDVGSVWTDGLHDYILIKVENNKLIFAFPYTNTAGVVGYNNALPTTTLTHKSGGTHTTDIPITTIATDQLYPSINHHSVEILADEKKVEDDGLYECDAVIVRETYHIICYQALQEYLKSNIGTLLPTDDIEGTLKLSHVYKFTAGGKCYLSTAIEVLKKTEFGACGIIQSKALSASTEETVLRCLPNVKSKSGVDFSKFVALSTYKQSLKFTKDDLIDENTPPHRHLDIIRKSNGEIKCGFEMGYIFDKTKSSHSFRLNNTHTFWDMRNTKKSYPVAFGEKTFEKGEYLTFLAYRNYLSFRNQIVTNVVEDEQAVYIYIDSAESELSNMKEMIKFLGKRIEIMESRNFALKNDIIDANGIMYEISTDGGYGILKITK